MASSSGSTCAACKHMRRKCVPGCIFAPYFPQEWSARFMNVNRVFGPSDEAKILNDVPPASRPDAVISLCFEAEVHLQDPVNGCLGYIETFQRQLQQLHQDIAMVTAQIHALDVLEGAAPPPPSMMQDASYYPPLQITERQDVLQSGGQHQDQDQDHGISPHEQLDTRSYDGGITDSEGGPSTELTLAPPQEQMRQK